MSRSLFSFDDWNSGREIEPVVVKLSPILLPLTKNQFNLSFCIFYRVDNKKFVEIVSKQFLDIKTLFLPFRLARKKPHFFFPLQLFYPKYAYGFFF